MPTKFTARRETKFLDALRQSASVEAACKAGGFSRASAFRWKAADPKFADKWNAAAEAGTDLLEDKSVEIATEGFVEYRETVTVTAKDGTTKTTVTERRRLSDRHLELQLKARRPDKYRERTQTEHVGKDGGALPPINISSLTNAQLDTLIERLSAAIAAGSSGATGGA